MTARSKVRRIRLHQYAIGRQTACDRAQLIGFLKRENAGERYAESERNRPLSQIATAGITMQDGRERSCPGFFLEDCNQIRIGISGMDNQRKTCLPRGSNMIAQGPCLGLPR